jgi:hypothetical protein
MRAVSTPPFVCVSIDNNASRWLKDLQLGRPLHQRQLCP